MIPGNFSSTLVRHEQQNCAAQLMRLALRRSGCGTALRVGWKGQKGTEQPEQEQGLKESRHFNPPFLVGRTHDWGWLLNRQIERPSDCTIASAAAASALV